MAINAIVSYDDTDNDLDALVLGQVLAGIGAELTLAYVRHTIQAERSREELEEHEAQALLERGARRLEEVEADQRVVVSASTPEGLKWLAEQEEADMIVFGSDYRTAIGHVSPGRSAQALLEGGPAALALAPSGFHGDPFRPIRRIGLLAVPGDDAALETARHLADAFHATLIRNEWQVDLLIVGSRSEAPEGRVMVTAQAEKAIENATFPVLVLARGMALRFPVAVGV